MSLSRINETPSRRTTILLLGVLLCAGGCFKSEADLTLENIQLKEQLRKRDNQVASQQAMLDDLRQQLQTARQLTDSDRAAIIAPTRLVLGRLTNGADYDGQPGDDGVTVHFQLLDDVGDPIKVTGDVTIELFDLKGENPKRLARCEYPASEVRQMWASTLLTYMYVIKCPFPEAKPGSDLTVRVTFLDYLSRSKLVGQTTVELR